MSLRALSLKVDQALLDLASVEGDRGKEELIIEYLKNNFDEMEILRAKVNPNLAKHIYLEQIEIKRSIEKVYERWESDIFRDVSYNIRSLIESLIKGHLEVHSVSEQIRQFLSRTDNFISLEKERQSLKKWSEKQISVHLNRPFVRTTVDNVGDRRRQLSVLADKIITLVSKIRLEQIPIDSSVSLIKNHFSSMDGLNIDPVYVHELKLWAENEINSFLHRRERESDPFGDNYDLSDRYYGTDNHDKYYSQCSDVHDPDCMLRSPNTCLACFEDSVNRSLYPEKVSSESPSVIQSDFEESPFTSADEILQSCTLSAPEVSETDVSLGSVEYVDSYKPVVPEFTYVIHSCSEVSECENLETLSEGIPSDETPEISPDIPSNAVVKNSLVIKCDSIYLESDPTIISESSENDNPIAVDDLISNTSRDAAQKGLEITSPDQSVLLTDVAFIDTNFVTPKLAPVVSDCMSVANSLNRNISDVETNLTSNEFPKFCPNDTMTGHAVMKIVLKFGNSFRAFGNALGCLLNICHITIQTLLGRNIPFNIDVDVLLGLVKQKK